ncbi:MAG TPA: DUF6526 family protein [Thermoanaerobaculia bacterium]|nr:DUF6526 family protein [Thermoanaerobaculia bacterium]
MPNEEQSYASHRRFHPIFHFFTIPILALNVVLQIVLLFWRPSPAAFTFLRVWGILVAIAIAAVALLARFYSLRQQDRIIRLEETLRLQQLLPEDLRSRINELRMSQLIGLRFCSDEELPEVTRAVLAGEVKSSDEIKRRVQQWRADHHRI